MATKIFIPAQRIVQDAHFNATKGAVKAIRSSWPPPSTNHWELRQGSNYSSLKVQLRESDRPLVTAPPEALSMRGRLEPLLHVASTAAWRLGAKHSCLRFAIQIHDEAPSESCLRYDASASDPKVLLPDPYALGSHGYKLFREQLIHKPLPPWEERLPLAFWRGASTGNKALTTHRIRQNLRYRLCRFSQMHPELLNARLTSIVQCRDQEAKDQLQLLLKEEDLLAPRCEPWQFGLHKHLIEIDGNVNSWGLLWKLLSGSCVLRVNSPRRQWYHHRLKPFQHIVPLAADLSDLPEKLAWCRSNPNSCESIAAAGQALAYEEVRLLGRRVVETIDALVNLT